MSSDGTVCVKCGAKNVTRIVDYCSVCGERAVAVEGRSAGAQSDAARKSLQFHDGLGERVNTVHLSSPGATTTNKSVSSENRELLAFVKANVEDAPDNVETYSDGIVICRLIAALAPSANVKFNAKPKMALQKLNNVHLAVTTMESLGIGTAGINTKDVVDGNEKQIMNIIRGLQAYARKAGTGAGGPNAVRRASVSPAQTPGTDHSSSGGNVTPLRVAQSPALTPASDIGDAFDTAMALSEPIRPAATTPVTTKQQNLPAPTNVYGKPIDPNALSPLAAAGARTPPATSPRGNAAASPSASLSPTGSGAGSRKTSMTPVSQLAQESIKQEEELRALDAKIAAMNAKLESLTSQDAPVVAQPVVLPPQIGVVDTAAMPHLAAPVAVRATATTTATTTSNGASASPARGPSPGGSRVVVIPGPAPSTPAPASASKKVSIDLGPDSSTEGEDDSEDAALEAQRTQQKTLDEREAAMERLKQWKKEEQQRKREQIERDALAELQSVAANPQSASTLLAATAVPPSPGADDGKGKKPARRRRRGAAPKGSKKDPNSVNGAGGTATNGSNDGKRNADGDDDGISDSPDTSDDEQVNAATAAIGSSGTALPPIPPKSDLLADKVRSGRKLRQRKQRDASRAERITVLENELDALDQETAAVRAQSEEVLKSGPVKPSSKSASPAPSPPPASDSKFYVRAARQDELRKQLGGNPAFLGGLRRLQAVVRGKNARRRRKLLQKRSYIAREIVESEKSYVRNLGLCIEHFYKPMQELSYINDLQLRQMFSEITVILGYNAHLCAQLEKRHARWQAEGQRLGDIFLNFVAYFRSYTSYVNNYNDATTLFYSLQRKNKNFQGFLAEKKVDPSLNGQELPAFLIMPIQRLPRYVMLLEDLLRNTPRDHGDYADLSTALAKVQEVADYVNEKKREAENINQVIDVQARMTGITRNLAEASRRFVRQGAVLNADSNNNKHSELMLFLFNDILVTGKETHGLIKMAENAKQLLGVGSKKSATPKVNRKGTGGSSSPFFGRKKPQLQAADDDREYKYQKTLLLSDCKLSAIFNGSSANLHAASHSNSGMNLNLDGASAEKMAGHHSASAPNFGATGAGGGASGAINTPSMGKKDGGAAGSAMALMGAMFVLKTPLDTLQLGCADEDEMLGWLHDIDATVMRLVERKRMRALRTAQHSDKSGGAGNTVSSASSHHRPLFDPTPGRHVVDRTELSWSGRLQLAGNSYFGCLLKPHMYVFRDADDPEPLGWLYLLSCHAVLGGAASAGDNTGPWNFYIHVPLVEGGAAAASPWMGKLARRVTGDYGTHHVSAPLAADKDAVAEEEVERHVYEFCVPSINDALNWCRETRNVILDSVKLPDDMCPLEVIHKSPTEENGSCADCGFVPTKFASVTLGVFLCAACAELHSEVLEGVSVIRDITEPYDINSQQRFELEALMGNTKRNKIFEKNAAAKGVAKARPTDSRETRTRWIKAK